MKIIKRLTSLPGDSLNVIRRTPPLVFAMAVLSLGGFIGASTVLVRGFRMVENSITVTGASTESLLIQDLTVGSTYDVGVAVVDKSGFKKMSAYDGTGEDLYTNSSSVNANFATNARVEIEKDGQAPSKPKAATKKAGFPN